jgi:hypothetical protein
MTDLVCVYVGCSDGNCFLEYLLPFVPLPFATSPESIPSGLRCSIEYDEWIHIPRITKEIQVIEAEESATLRSGLSSGFRRSNERPQA